jgi:hypothetical protein
MGGFVVKRKCQGNLILMYGLHVDARADPRIKAEDAQDDRGRREERGLDGEKQEAMTFSTNARSKRGQQMPTSASIPCYAHPRERQEIPC